MALPVSPDRRSASLSVLTPRIDSQTLHPWLADKSKVCPPTLLSSVYTLFGTTVFQGG